MSTICDGYGITKIHYQTEWKSVNDGNTWREMNNMHCFA